MLLFSESCLRFSARSPLLIWLWVFGKSFSAMNPEAEVRDMPAQMQRLVIGIDYGTTYTGMHCVLSISAQISF